MREENSRSVSPAKRTASEMDDDHANDDGHQTNIDSTKRQSYSEFAQDASSMTTSLPASSQTMHGNAPNSSSTMFDSDEPVPSLDDQVQSVVAQLEEKEEKEGLPGYVLSRQWLGRVVARSKFNEQMGPFDKDSLEGEIGPVDNESITDFLSIDTSLKDEAGKTFIPLKKGMQLDTDMYLLPEASWNQVIKWYGMKQGQSPIIRYQHIVSSSDSDFSTEYQYELYPPIFTIRKLVADKNNNSPESHAAAPRILSSTSKRYMEFLKVAKRQLGITPATKVKVARVVDVQVASDAAPSSSGGGMLSPPASRDASPTRAREPIRRNMDTATYKQLDRNSLIDVLDKQDETMNEKYNGKATLAMLGLSVDQTLIICEDSNKVYSDLPKKLGAKSNLAKETDSAPSSGRASPAGMMTRGRYNSNNGRAKGSVGLTNLGNTCYMNSALQCMRACQELSTFFISNSFKRELNPDNPIGHKGLVASSYANLLHEVYDKSPSSVAPRAFKNTLGRFAPMFSGYGQQDSQEFMSFLVDALHEDLNRVKKKPYRENPDSDDATVHDPEAIKQLGEVFRDNHRARNSSIITDLFNGFYKNKLVCPDCSKVSITFDPFSLLTLQLPMEHYWEWTFSFIPLHDKPFKIRVDNSKGQTIKNLKQFAVSRLPGLDIKRLIMVEFFSNKFYRIMEDRMSITEAHIVSNDDMVFIELEEEPTNWPIKQKIRSMLDINKKPDEDQQEDEQQLVAVFHRTQAYHNSKNIVQYPSLITISPEDASDYAEIQRKLLAIVAKMTSIDLNELVAEEAARVQSEDLDASDSIEEVEGGSKYSSQSGQDAEVTVKTTSLASDSFVDVSMAGTQEAPNNLPRTTPIYSFLEKGAPIPAPLNKLFEVRVGHSNEVIPTGGLTNTSTSGLTSHLPLLSARLPKPSDTSSTENSGSTGSPSPTDTSDSTTEDMTDKQDETQASYADDNDTPSEPLKPTKAERQRTRKANKFAKNPAKANKIKPTYGGGNKRSHLQKKWRASRQSTEESDHEVPVDGDVTLIRPNDYLMIDWEQEWYDKLFGGYDNDLRKHARLFEDTELESRQSQRENRRRKGVKLEDCFDETSKEEILTEENAWYCGNCKERRQASKQLEIWTSPDILVIHLKRFGAGRMSNKIDVLVEFPVEGLDLSRRVGVDDGKPLIYDLFAVDNHYGGLGGGHYTAYAKNFFDQQWYEYNDSSVSKCNPASAVTKSAYLLFYRRRSDEPLGPTNVQKMVHRYMDGEDMSDSDSDRSTSPSQSGNGTRPTGLKFLHNGASFTGPLAAGRPLAGGAHRGLDGADNEEIEELDHTNSQITLYDSTRRAMSDLDEAPPAYDEDEGVGMEQDAEFDRTSGVGLNALQQQSWSFAAVDNQNANNSDMDDAGSMELNVSDDDAASPPISYLDSTFDGATTFQLERHEVAPVDEEMLERNDDEAIDDAVHASVEEVPEAQEGHFQDNDTTMRQ